MEQQKPKKKLVGWLAQDDAEFNELPALLRGCVIVGVSELEGPIESGITIQLRNERGAAFSLDLGVSTLLDEGGVPELFARINAWRTAWTDMGVGDKHPPA